MDVSEASLQFAPVTLREGRAVVPFIFDRGTHVLEGALRLGSFDELMACYWHHGTDAETLALVWTSGP